MSRTLVVIGGTGFIGAAVAAAAAAEGWRVVVTGYDAGQDGLPIDSAVTAARLGLDYTTLDVTDRRAVDTVLDRSGADAIVSLAAFGVGHDGLAAGAQRLPATAVDVNIRGLVNVIESAAALGIERVGWASSSTVYGPAGDRDLVDEDGDVRPDSIYGATKVGAEHVARVLADELGLAVAGVRLPLVYGPGRWYGGSQESLVRFVGELASARAARIEAWTGAADWIHVDDSAQALLCAVRTAAPHPVYNVVGHRGSLAELGCALVTHSGGDADLVESLDGTPDLPAMDDRRIRAELGFTPRFADVAAGAADYLRRTRTATEPQEDW